MRIGRYEVTALETGRFRLDGGAMFGVVPKPLWEQSDPADGRNRIELALRCLFLAGDERKILVDTGMGTKWDSKARGIYDLHGSESGVIGALRDRGVDSESVTDVILTHLHFDHAGGATRRNEAGLLEPAFPRARYHLQRRNLEWARKPNEREKASYLAENFEPLADSGLLDLADGSGDLFPGVSVAVSDGHTEGLQMVRISGPDAKGARVEVWFTADLIPTSAHVHLPWIAAYDLSALVSLGEKRALLEGIAGREAWLVYEHDRRYAASRVVREAGGRFRALDPVETL